MSSSVNPPNFSYFYQELIQEINVLRVATLSVDDETIKKTVIKVLDEIKSDYTESHRKSLIKPNVLLNITQKSQEKIHQIALDFFSINPPIDNPLADDYNQKISHFERSLSNFACIYEHRLEIKERGLETFLGKEEWANQIFIELFNKKHPWAMERLEIWMEEKSSLVFELMLDLAVLQKNPGVLGFFIQNKDNPELEEAVKRGMLRSRETLKAIEWLICQTLHREHCSWMKNIFVLEIRDRGNRDYIQILKGLFFVPTVNSPWINEFVVLSFAQHKQWAVEMVFEYLKDYEDIDFTKALIDLVVQQEEHLHILTAFAVLFKADHSFSKVLLSTFSFLAARVERGINFVSELVLFGQKNPTPNYFQWQMCSDFEHICILQLLMRREHCLVGVLTGSMDLVQFRDKPISKCFPNAGSILIGNSEIATFLSQQLASYGLSSYYLLQVDQWPDLSNVAQPLIGEHAPNLWVQDLASVHENQIRIPNAALHDSEHNAKLFEHRKKRIAARSSEALEDYDGVLGLLGNVNNQLSQLVLLSFFIRKGISVQKMAVQFSSLEGGNCLIGEQNGRAYAIIGKDSVEANRFYLQKELAQLGLRKSIGNRWSLEAPYSPEECILENDDLKFFFMLDLGLESVDQVYFIEQPAYHLDVAMLLVNEKKVLINNSRMSSTVFLSHFKSEIEAGKFPPEKSSILDQRLSDLIVNCEAFATYENAATLDLLAQGFEVIEVGGNYCNYLEDHPLHHQANLFNAVTITSPEGKKILIGLQGDEFIEKIFKDLIQTHFADIAEYITLTQEMSEGLLLLGGGIHCKTLIFKHPHLL